MKFCLFACDFKRILHTLLQPMLLLPCRYFDCSSDRITLCLSARLTLLTLTLVSLDRFLLKSHNAAS